MIRAARSGDEAAIEAFLQDHAESSMFLRSNLARFGLNNRDHPNATSYFIDEQDGIRAVFGLSNAGFLLLQTPCAGPEFWAQLPETVSGQKIAGIIGEVSQVSHAKAALELEKAGFSLERPEPLYRLSLDQMRDPGAATIRPPIAADAQLLTSWLRAYQIEAFKFEDNAALENVISKRVKNILAGDDTRLLVKGGKAVAMTAFNARLPDMVQIGGVYTPPELRNQGLARRVVAAHLREARAEGVETAILFASGAPACRAYEALGFQQIGHYTLAILAKPQIIESAS